MWVGNLKHRRIDGSEIHHDDEDDDEEEDEVSSESEGGSDGEEAHLEEEHRSEEEGSDSEGREAPRDEGDLSGSDSSESSGRVHVTLDKKRRLADGGSGRGVGGKRRRGGDLESVRGLGQVSSRHTLAEETPIVGGGAEAGGGEVSQLLFHEKDAFSPTAPIQTGQGGGGGGKRRVIIDSDDEE